MRNGATLDREVIICDGNCVTNPTPETGILKQKVITPIGRVIQNEYICSITVSGNVDELRIYNLSGRMVLSGAVTGNVFEIDKRSVPAGVYLVLVMGKDSMRTGKILLWE